MKSRPVKIRLPEKWLALIEQRCREEGIPIRPPRGKTGGAAEWIRRLIAKELQEEMIMPHEVLPIERGGSNFAHTHNLRIWLVDKNLHPKPHLNPMNLGLVLRSKEFLEAMVLSVNDFRFVCTLKDPPTKALNTGPANDWDPAAYVILELHKSNSLGLLPGFYTVPRTAEQAIDAIGLDRFTQLTTDKMELSDDYSRLILNEIRDLEENRGDSSL